MAKLPGGGGGLNFSMDADNTMQQEEDDDQFKSSAPMSVRGPFDVFDTLREYRSKQRLRYKMNGFNLDMRYITPNIIALAAPVDRGILDTTTKNHVFEVNRFFRTHHQGKVKFYSLIAEHGKFVFDTHKLESAIVHDFAFLDHEVPGLMRMQAFCNHVKAWLSLDPQNVVAIMCTSGRNRTAVMICAYLLFAWPQEFQMASDAMAYFSWCRMRTGEAIEIPSQIRYVSYFSQRFAAIPQVLKMSRVFIPVKPLQASKLRLEIYQLRVTSEHDRGDENEIRMLWTSKGKQLGKIEEDTHYVVIDLPETLKLEGDIKLCFYSRKYDNSGIFEPIFSFWFNCGFIDHTPVVWDMNCFDNVPPKLKKELPVDFHIQTLFVGKPRVACSIEKDKPARMYCWDCDDPFLSEDASIELHRARTIIGADGDEMQVRSGPVHRFHTLVDEDCAICKDRRAKFSKGLLGQAVHNLFDALTGPERDREFNSTSPMDYLKSKTDYMISDKYEGNTAPVHGNDGKLSAAFSEEQGFKLLKSEERYKKLAKREEVLHYSGILTSGTKRPPLFGMPSIFCHDTGEFLCAWCSKNALRPSDRKSLTKTAIPVVGSSALHYSGCARQEC